MSNSQDRPYKPCSDSLPPLCYKTFQRQEEIINDLKTKVDSLDTTVRNGINLKIAAIHGHVRAQWICLSMVGAAFCGIGVWIGNLMVDLLHRLTP